MQNADGGEHYPWKYLVVNITPWFLWFRYGFTTLKKEESWHLIAQTSDVLRRGDSGSIWLQWQGVFYHANCSELLKRRDNKMREDFYSVFFFFLHFKIISRQCNLLSISQLSTSTVPHAPISSRHRWIYNEDLILSFSPFFA